MSFNKFDLFDNSGQYVIKNKYLFEQRIYKAEEDWFNCLSHTQKNSIYENWVRYTYKSFDEFIQIMKLEIVLNKDLVRDNQINKLLK